MGNPAIYSFKDVTVSIINPAIGEAFVTSGQVGLAELHLSQSTQRTIIEMAADGTAMISYIAGDNGTFTLMVQQTSIIYQFLLNLFNLLKVAADGGDPSNWAATVIQVKSLTDGSLHLMTGVGFDKIPDKPYMKQGQNIPWGFQAAYIQTTTLPQLGA
jgi:hypothetical protein